MSDWNVTPTLAGAHVRLVPLQSAHASALGAAAIDGELWHLGYTSVPSPDTAAAYVDKALAMQAAGKALAFAVLDAAGGVVGSTRFYALDPDAPRVLIGYTWYARRVQRTAVNTEAKLLLLRHAFHVLDCISVGFETSTLNRASRTAIARLGAQQDGVLRSHMRHPDGSVRDTVSFSIIRSEWPSVQRSLETMLETTP